MWDFLSNAKHYVIPHKLADLSWIKNKDSEIINCKYDQKHQKTSAGFRAELFLKPNTTYQLEIEAKLLLGDFAFIYVECGQQKLVPRFKIYPAEQNYVLNHSFTTPSHENKNDPVSVFVGILFFHADQNYEIMVHKFKIQEVFGLTESNLIAFTNQQTLVDPSILSSRFDINQGNNNNQRNNNQRNNNQLNNNNNNQLSNNNFQLNNNSQLNSNNNLLQLNNNHRHNNPDNTNYTYANSQLTNRHNVLIKDQMTSSILHEPQQQLPLNSELSYSIYQQLSQFGNNINSNLNNIGKNNNISNLKNQLGNKDNTNQSILDWDNSTVYTPSTIQKNRINSLASLNDLIVDPDDFQDLQPQNDHDWFPAIISKKLIFTFNELLEQQKRKIHISITTTPKRLGKLHKIIDSLLKQSINIFKIHIIIPNRHKRFNSPYLINSKQWYFKPNRKNIDIIRVPDVGPINKLHSLVTMGREVEPMDIILTADDDYTYPKHWAFCLALNHLLYPKFKTVYSMKAFHQGKVIRSLENKRQPVNVDCLMGEYGCSYVRKYIRDPAIMLKQVGYSNEAFYSDDVLISNYLAKENIARILLPAVNTSIENDVYPQKMPWSNSHDSLQKMNPPQVTRYLQVMETLKKKHFFFLDNHNRQLNKNKRITLSELSTRFDNQNDNINTNEKNSTNSSENNVLSYPILQKTNNIPKLMNHDITGHNISESLRKKLFDPSIFANLKVRYISYLKDFFHIEWYLLYIKKLPRASLELPNLPNNISLPPEFAPYVHQDIENYDCIIIDLAFCKNSFVQIKTNKPIYFIYRFPAVGYPHIIFQEAKKISLRTKFRPKLTLLSNNEVAHDLPEPNFIWRILPDLTIKNVNMIMDPKKIHLTHIVSENCYHNNLELLLDFWKNVLSAQSQVYLHLGVCSPLFEIVQRIIQEQKIPNISCYNQSSVFGTLIHKCDHYLSLGYYLDLYAVWAYQKNKNLIMIKYGEFKKYPRILPIPFTLGDQNVCPELLTDHSNCDQKTCSVYGYKKIINVPIVNQDELKNLLTQLKTSR